MLFAVIITTRTVELKHIFNSTTLAITVKRFALDIIMFEVPLVKFILLCSIKATLSLRYLNNCKSVIDCMTRTHAVSMADIMSVMKKGKFCKKIFVFRTIKDNA